jgi:hypothetical protein
VGLVAPLLPPPLRFGAVLQEVQSPDELRRILVDADAPARAERKVKSFEGSESRDGLVLNHWGLDDHALLARRGVLHTQAHAI